MNWLEFVADCESSSSSLIESILEEGGAQAITLQDAGDQPLLEPLPGETPLWSLVRIKALFATDIDRGLIESRLHDQAPGFYGHWQLLENREWERIWLERFKPRKYGQRLWIIPSESTPQSEDAVNVFLDPGMAFGTGDHATTNLCLQWLDRAQLRDKRVLDFGHGSGVLAIAAKKLGAGYVAGVDIDPQAILAGRQNAASNELHEGIEFSEHPAQTGFDVLVANILAGPLIEMAQKLSTYLNTGGKIALSGILVDQVTAVQRAYSPWVRWESMRELDDWALICGTRCSVSTEPGC